MSMVRDIWCCHRLLRREILRRVPLFYLGRFELLEERDVDASEGLASVAFAVSDPEWHAAAVVHDVRGVVPLPLGGGGGDDVGVDVTPYTRD